MGQTIMIQASQAEKNRAATASKFKKDQDKFGVPSNAKAQKKGSDENNQVYVGGLVDVLNAVTESEIRQVSHLYSQLFSGSIPLVTSKILNCLKTM